LSAEYGPELFVSAVKKAEKLGTRGSGAGIP